MIWNKRIRRTKKNSDEYACATYWFNHYYSSFWICSFRFFELYSNNITIMIKIMEKFCVFVFFSSSFPLLFTKLTHTRLNDSKMSWTILLLTQNPKKKLTKIPTYFQIRVLHARFHIEKWIWRIKRKEILSYGLSIRIFVAQSID